MHRVLERKIMTSVDHISWGCPKKKTARLETIIKPYRKYIGQKLPPNKQYWTMCSDCTNKHGQLDQGCEFSQMVNEGLITPNQFYGVDIEEKYIESNKILDTDAHWIWDDFYYAMRESYNNNMFNPGIVNYDTILNAHKRSS